MNTTTVVNCRKEKYDVYIGRPSKWGNPTFLTKDSDRIKVIEEYRSHLMRSPHLLASLYEIQGKVLGCWCKPKPCHGDVLAEICDIGVLAFKKKYGYL